MPTRRLACLLALAVPFAWSQTPVPYEVLALKQVPVAMRDGVRLLADVYLPARNGAPAPGKFPCLLERTPYGRSGSAAAYFVPQGYVAISQSVRGRYGSEGRWRMLLDDPADGYDTARWILSQPWSDGTLGSIGGSYTGGTQYALALSNPPGLRAMFPTDSASNPGLYGIRHNGAFELRWFNWMFRLGNRPSRHARPRRVLPRRTPEARAALRSLGDQVPDYLRNLPCAPASPPCASPRLRSLAGRRISHASYDDFWKANPASVTQHAPAIRRAHLPRHRLV